MIDTLVNLNGCDSVVTYTLSLLPQPTQTESIAFCPGASVSIGGNAYTQAGTVIDTIPGLTGCDTIITYKLSLLPLLTRAEAVEFCAGETVSIGGQGYTQPGTVVDTLPGLTGCDTIVTYTLQYRSAPNAGLSIDCPEDIFLASGAGLGAIPVQYAEPTAGGDCPCPDIVLVRTEGPASGAPFPVGTTRVCYRADDACGNSATCCFFVTVREPLPCDVKQIGCMRYELLGITQNSAGERTYRIRATNSCPNPMTYTVIQLPDGVTAVRPASNSTFNASPDGRPYEVRNPNFTPFYSIRFKSTTDSLANNVSSIFTYTLPQQSAPDNIHVSSRLEPQLFVEAYLNTFYCPVLPEAPTPSRAATALRVFPNPTSGTLYADLSHWTGEALRLRVFDSQGRQVLEHRLTAAAAPQRVGLPEQLPAGLYFLEALPGNGGRETASFVIER